MMKIALPEFTCWLGRLVNKTGLKCYNAPSREYSKNGSHDYGCYFCCFFYRYFYCCYYSSSCCSYHCKIAPGIDAITCTIATSIDGPATLTATSITTIPPATTGYCCEYYHVYDYCCCYHCYHDSCYYHFYFYSYSFYCHSCFGCCCCDPRCYSYYYYCCSAILALLTVWLLTQYLIHLGFFLPCSSGSRYMFLFITWQQAHYKTKQKR